ncbi:hypothetical protein CS022_08050 [Veronia nyctiphanis]|uniref:HTH cro/C1-type domain-containing protein n=1 Tax=Veronia nyctiphanis TaxID=1278244 RepID=A0A4Q0YSN2_9GAMM|nr:helix-turn-helix domain-containing protein [Veronia nyctiphanis]RXJ73683.1 hypothetical protein CS022_08050 [Veronia nyctiphanis]
MSSSQAHQLLATFKDFLKTKGITYKYLASRAGMTELTVKRLMNRPHLPLDQLLTLFAAADTSIAEVSTLQANLKSDVNLMSNDIAKALSKQPALFFCFTRHSFWR